MVDINIDDIPRGNFVKADTIYTLENQRKHAYFYFIIVSEVARYFSCTQDLSSQGHCTSSQGPKYNQSVCN